MDDPALAEPDRCGPGRSAGDDPSVASRGLESFLALEIPKAGRAPEDRSWPARSHPTDQQGKPAVGRVPDPWRALDAGVRGCPVDGLQIHGAGWDAAFAKLEDISSKGCVIRSPRPRSLPVSDRIAGGLHFARRWRSTAARGEIPRGDQAKRAAILATLSTNFVTSGTSFTTLSQRAERTVLSRSPTACFMKRSQARPASLFPDFSTAPEMVCRASARVGSSFLTT